ncbi:MAG TPA: hypothetical protein VE422_48135 [Terriglobia bacterium]|nr:hypothetical protein [Terriglobia bacterium]
MKNTIAARTSKIQRSSIEDISTVGTELSDEHLQLASGGLRKIEIIIGPVTTEIAASCTYNDDTDWRKDD